MPCGTRMAASTTPATRSLRSQPRRYERAAATPGTHRSTITRGEYGGFARSGGQRRRVQGDRDLGTEDGAAGQLEAIAAPEAAGVEPVGRSGGVEQTHSRVRDGEQLRAVDGLRRRLSPQATRQPLRHEVPGAREGPTFVLGDDPQ